MPLCARLVLERVLIEHMAHAGTQNGELTVTYDDFVRFGLSSRPAAARGIRIAVGLGFLDVTRRGRRSFGGVRQASQYGIAWLPRSDGTLASNRWRKIVTREQAAETTALAIPVHSRRRPPSDAQTAIAA